MSYNPRGCREQDMTEPLTQAHIQIKIINDYGCLFFFQLLKWEIVDACSNMSKP